MSRRAFMIAVAVVLIPAPLTLARKKKDRDCDDFKSQKKAQKFFLKHNPKKDPYGLDADGDGIACEELD